VKVPEGVKEAFYAAFCPGGEEEALKAALGQLREELEGDEALTVMAHELERLGWELDDSGAQTVKDLRCAVSDGFDSVLGDKEKGS